MSWQAACLAYESSEVELLQLISALGDAGVEVGRLLDEVHGEDHEAVLKMIAERTELISLLSAATGWKVSYDNMKEEESDGSDGGDYAERTEDELALTSLHQNREEDSNVSDDEKKCRSRFGNADDNDEVVKLQETKHSNDDEEDLYDENGYNIGELALKRERNQYGAEEYYNSDDEEEMRHCWGMGDTYGYSDDEPMYGGVSDDWEEYLDKIGHDKSYD